LRPKAVGFDGFGKSRLVTQDGRCDNLVKSNEGRFTMG